MLGSGQGQRFTECFWIFRCNRQRSGTVSFPFKGETVCVFEIKNVGVLLRTADQSWDLQRFRLWRMQWCAVLANWSWSLTSVFSLHIRPHVDDAAQSSALALSFFGSNLSFHLPFMPFMFSYVSWFIGVCEALAFYSLYTRSLFFFLSWKPQRKIWLP